MSDFNAKTTAEEVGSRYADNIKGKTVVITGGTWGGLGAETARVIAKNGAGLLIITGRKESILDETIGNIKKDVPNAEIRGVIMDLASLESVKRAAAEINTIVNHIDVLINNAGVMACPYATTKDGFEMQFGTNHLGHFLFTSLLKDQLFKSKSPRIVNLSSVATFIGPVLFDDINFTKGVRPYEEFVSYGQSKTANVLFTRELSDKFHKSHNLTAITLHPGGIQTNLLRHQSSVEDLAKYKDFWGNPVFTEEGLNNFEWKTIPQGASTTMVAAFSDDKQTGSYLDNCQDATHTLRDYAVDKENQQKLWKVSEEMTGVKFE